MQFPDSSSLQDWADSAGNTVNQLIDQFSDYEDPRDFLNDTANTVLDILDDLQETLPESAQDILEWAVRIERNDCENCVIYGPEDPIMPITICIRNPHCRIDLPRPTCSWQNPFINLIEQEETPENFDNFINSFPDGIPLRCPPPLPQLPQNPDGSHGLPGEIYTFNGWQRSYTFIYKIRFYQGGSNLLVKTIIDNPASIVSTFNILAPFLMINSGGDRNTLYTTTGENFFSASSEKFFGQTFADLQGRVLPVGSMASALTASCNILVEGSLTEWPFYKDYNFGWGYTIYFSRSGITQPEEEIDDRNRIFPPTNQPNEEPSMNQDCCARLERRLKRIESYCYKIGNWTGSFTGGMLVPDRLNDIEYSPDRPVMTVERIIENIPQFLAWYVEKLQELNGTWPVRFKDNKDNEAAVPNFAESQKAIFMKLMSQDRTLASLQKGLIKVATETALTRQESVLSTSYGSAIADFLEMPLEETLFEVLHQFSIPQDRDIAPEDIDTDQETEDFFESSYFKCKTVDFDPTKPVNGKKPETFGTHAKRILKIMEILLAVHSVSINKDDIAGDLKKFVNGLKKFSKGEALDGRTVGTDDDNDLSQYLEKVEKMFAPEENAPTDSATNPWGQSLEERPRIIIRGRQPDEGDDI